MQKRQPGLAVQVAQSVGPAHASDAATAGAVVVIVGNATGPEAPSALGVGVGALPVCERSGEPHAASTQRRATGARDGGMAGATLERIGGSNWK